MPHRSFDPFVADVILQALTTHNKVSVFDEHGGMLWFSPNWMDAAGPMENPREPLGRKWLEFVHPAHLARAEQWIAADDGAEVVLVCHAGSGGPDCWVIAALLKRRVGKFWLCFGDNRMAEPDEVPPPL